MENEDILVKDILENGSSNSLKDLFILRTSRWKYWMISGEGCSWSQFSDLEQNIRSYIAFSLIPVAIEIILTQNEIDLFATALSLLSSLITASNTTEIPILLKERWAQIELKVTEFENKDTKFLINQIKAWYRNNI